MNEGSALFVQTLHLVHQCLGCILEEELLVAAAPSTPCICKEQTHEKPKIRMLILNQTLK